MAQQDTDSWMWERARELLERAAKLQRRCFQPVRPRRGHPTWEAPVDIFETEDELWIIAALPGVEAENVEVLVDGGILTISGERCLPRQCQHAIVHRIEIPQGTFERSIELPPGRFEVGPRELRGGCLVLRLLKVS